MNSLQGGTQANHFNAGNATSEQPRIPLHSRAIDANIQSQRTRDFALNLLHDLRNIPVGKDEAVPKSTAIDEVLRDAALNSEITLRLLEEIRGFIFG